MLMIPVGPSHVQFPAFNDYDKLLCPKHEAYERYQVGSTCSYFGSTYNYFGKEIVWILGFECGFQLEYVVTSIDLITMSYEAYYSYSHRSPQDWAQLILGSALDANNYST